MAVPANMRAASQMTPELEAAARAAGADLDDPGTPNPDDGGTSPEVPDDGANRLEGDGGNGNSDEFPDNWFGHNIKEYAEEHGAEAARVYFGALKDANRVVSSQLQSIAEMRKQAQEEARKQAIQQRVAPLEDTTPSVDDQSDEELLEALGIDTSVLQFDDVGKPVAQVARLAASLQAELESVRNQVAAGQGEAKFFGDLERLQQTYGALPQEFDRGTLEEFAVQRQIFDPEALYFTIMGPTMAFKPPTPDAGAPKPADGGTTLRDLKKTISSPRRQAPASQTVQVEKPKTLKDYFENAKKTENVSGDPFAWEA